MADQLEEYRRQMQQRYRNTGPAPSNPRPPPRDSRNDEELAKKLQEDEESRRAEQMRQDEELARKLQGGYAPNAYGTPVYPPPEGSAYRPPEYIPAGQSVPPPNYSAYPQGYPPQGYPPQGNPLPPSGYNPPPSQPRNPPAYNPPNYPPSNYQANPSQNRASYQSNPAPVQSGCLPRVQDKCFGVNTQVCVLASAALMTIGIIATLIALSA